MLVKLLGIATSPLPSLMFAEGKEKRLEMQFRPDTQEGAEAQCCNPQFLDTWLSKGILSLELHSGLL